MLKKIILLFLGLVNIANAQSMCEILDFVSYNTFEQEVPLSKNAIINSLKENKGGIVLDVKSLKDDEVAIYPSYNTSDFTFLKNKQPSFFTEQQWGEIKLLDKNNKVSTESAYTAKELFNYFYDKDKMIKVGFIIKPQLSDKSLRELAFYAKEFPNVYFLANDSETLGRIRKYYDGFLGIWVGSPVVNHLNENALRNMIKAYGNIGIYASESRENADLELYVANKLGLPYYFVQNSFFSNLQEPFYKKSNNSTYKETKTNFNSWLYRVNILPTGMVIMENRKLFCH